MLLGTHAAHTADPAIWTGTDTDVAAVLNRAADLIEERGWTRGNGWTDLDGSTEPLCIQGAIGAAMGVRTAVGWRCPAMYAVMDYLGIERGLFSWNDRLLYTDGRALNGYVGGSLDAAEKHAAEQAIETLRAAAIIAAAETTDVRIVAPESWLPEAELVPVPVASLVGAVV